MTRYFILPVVLLFLTGSIPLESFGDEDSPARYYKGNTHTHSLWSDGNDFPEMITAWYKDRGYDFMALSDHNVLAEGDRWMSIEAIKKRQRALGRDALSKYVARYGEDWVETRDRNEKTEVRLKPLSEYRTDLEKDGKFLILQAEEISNAAGGKPIHINAINLETVIPAIKERDAAKLQEVIRKTSEAVTAQEEATGRPILAHLNHPNFQWAITAEDLARVPEMGYFEIYNGHPGINHLGDETRPSDEAVWDIANTIRLAELECPPLYGVATDDSHTYHGGDVSPGRGWIMVRSKTLEADALVNAMKAGDFYCSSGVTLDSITWNGENRSLQINVAAEEGISYEAELIGTRKGYDATRPATENGIGEVLATASGSRLRFEIPEDALFGRVTITSSKKHPNPSFPEQTEQAWTQPFGWR